MGVEVVALAAIGPLEATVGKPGLRQPASINRAQHRIIRGVIVLGFLGPQVFPQEVAVLAEAHVAIVVVVAIRKGETVAGIAPFLPEELLERIGDVLFDVCTRLLGNRIVDVPLDPHVIIIRPQDVLHLPFGLIGTLVTRAHRFITLFATIQTETRFEFLNGLCDVILFVPTAVAPDLEQIHVHMVNPS